MVPLRIRDTLARLDEGFLRVRPPLSPALHRDARVLVSTDWFATDPAEIPLEIECADGPYFADLPLAPGGSIQYRFAAASRHDGKEIFLDHGGANHAISLPATFAHHPVGDAVETLFALLDAGRVVALAAGTGTGAEEPALLFNLLGDSAWRDALARAGLPQAVPRVLVADRRRDDHFAGPGDHATPTAHFTKRIDDPAFPRTDRIRVLPVAEGTPLRAALDRLDAVRHFPLCGALPWPFPESADGCPVALLSAFFATWIDALVCEGELVLRDGTDWR